MSKNQQRGNSSRRGSRGGRGGGGNTNTQVPTFAGGLVGGNYVPPPLPISIQRLIDGRTLASVRVEYTPSGSVILAVPVKGDPMPLHEWRAARESSVRAASLKEKRELFAGRVAAREIAGVVIPDTFDSPAQVESFLGGLTKENRKLVEMTNKEFRAFKGTSSGPQEDQKE